MSKIFVNGYNYSSSRTQKKSRWFRWTSFFILLLIIFFAAIVALIELFPPQGIPILEYHKVNDSQTDEYTIHPRDFALQMDEIKRQGYTTISILDFLKAKKGKLTLPEKPIVISFDDGYKDNLTTALPILEERQMNMTLFVVVNRIGNGGYLSWQDLHEMERRNVEIGSHTANHLILPDETREQIEEEISKSKLLLEWNKLKTVFTLSYPNGKYSENLIEVLKRNEYLAAVTGDSGLNTFETNPYLLQRIYIPRNWFGEKFMMHEFRLRLWKAKLFTFLRIQQHKS